MARGKKAAKELSPEEKLQQALVPVEEQPYLIPENWCWIYWGNIGEFTAGSAFKNEYQGFAEYQIPFYKVGSLKYSDVNGILYDNSNTINEEIRAKLKAALIPSQSIIFAKIGEAIRLNRRSINAVPCCIDNNLMAFQAKECFWRYAFYWTLGLDLYTYTNATTVPAIRKSDLEAISFPLPPFSEQRRIVSRIESLFAKLDEAKEKAKAVVDGVELRKSAILHKAFTGELTERWRKEHGVGLESWKRCFIGEVFDLQAGKNISAKEISSQQTDLYRYPCFGGNGIRGYVEQFNREGEHPIIGRQGALCGNINLANNQFYATEHAVVVSYKMDVSTPWAYHYLNFLNLNQYATATAQPGLAVSNIVKVPIQYVPFEEQQELSRILDALLNKEQHAKEAAEAVLSQIDTMKKAILARAFRGELGTNDPSEEWAGEMIKAVL